MSPNGRWVVTQYVDVADMKNYVSLTDTTTGKQAHDETCEGDYPYQQAPSPDGKYLAWTGSEVGVAARNVITNKDVGLKGVNAKIRHGNPRFSPDGKVLLVNVPRSYYDVETPPHVARWDVTTGERLPDWKLPAVIKSWAIDYKNNRVVALAGGCVFRIDIATGKPQGPPDGFIGEIRPALSPDGKRVAVGDAAGVLRVWDAPFTGKPRTLRESGSAVHDLTFSGDGRTLHVGYADCSVGIWDIAKDQETGTLKPPAKGIRGLRYAPFCVAISPDGKTLVGQVAAKRMWAWDVGSGKVLWEELASKEKPGVTGCRPAFAPDSSVLYYGRDRGDVSKFDPRTGEERVRYETAILMRADVKQLALTPDGRRLVAHAYEGASPPVLNDGELAVFEVGSEAAVWRLKFKGEEAIDDLALAAGGAVVTAHADGTIRGWKARDGARVFTLRAPNVFTLRGPKDYVRRLKLSADGKFAITDAPDTTALVWKLPE